MRHHFAKWRHHFAKKRHHFAKSPYCSSRKRLPLQLDMTLVSFVFFSFFLHFERHHFAKFWKRGGGDFFEGF
jgi:hypothetical protein